jgi:hypothetical protein
VLNLAILMAGYSAEEGPANAGLCAGQERNAMRYISVNQPAQAVGSGCPSTIAAMPVAAMIGFAWELPKEKAGRAGLWTDVTT